MGPDLLEFFNRHDKDLKHHPGVITFEGTITYSDGSAHEISVQKSTFSHFDGTRAGTVTMILSDRIVTT